MYGFLKDSAVSLFKFSPAFFKRRSPASRGSGAKPHVVARRRRNLLRHFLFCGLSAAGTAAAIGFLLCLRSQKKKAAGSAEVARDSRYFVLVAGIYFGLKGVHAGCGEKTDSCAVGCSPRAPHSPAGCASRRNNAALWRIGEGAAEPQPLPIPLPGFAEICERRARGNSRRVSPRRLGQL